MNEEQIWALKIVFCFIYFIFRNKRTKQIYTTNVF